MSHYIEIIDEQVFLESQEEIIKGMGIYHSTNIQIIAKVENCRELQPIELINDYSHDNIPEEKLQDYQAAKTKLKEEN